MSENLKRGNPDFSKYDSMSIGELEEILRADAQGPERDDSDVDEILYVMEVLAKKRRLNGIAGKTVLEAYQEFQHHYLPMVEEKEDIESVQTHKSTIIPFRRIAAVAASLVLVFTLATSANAFSIMDIWNAVARWAEETFSFSMSAEISQPTPSDTLRYHSLQEVLSESEINVHLPTWIPEGYTLSDIIIDQNPKQDSYVAIYLSDDNMLKISVQSFLDGHPEQIEMSKEFREIYAISGKEYYLFCNYTQARIAWIDGSHECYITGKLSLDELKKMIDSIEKG